MGETADIAELLRQSTWMRRLAMSLVRDDAAADDLVQETWILALRNPPRAGQTVRPWLGAVLRNVMRAKLRSDARRARREDASAEKEPHVPSPEELVGAVELQRQLAAEVLRLEEPYRATVLRVFHEGMTPTELATREGLPAGTVRWRLKQGLDQLRRELDRKHAGNRGAWKRALAPLAGEKLARVSLAKSPLASIVKGASIMKVATAVAVVAGAGVALWSFNHETRAQPPQPPAATQPPAVAAAVAPAKAPAPAPSREPVRVDKHARADLLKRIDDARRAVPATTAGAPAAVPALDKQYISEQMSGLVPLVQECVDNALARHPGLQGQIVVGFSIVADPSVGGLVGESRVIDAKSTIADKDLRECIQETMYAAKFPAPEAGGEVHVEYPFILRSSSAHGDGKTLTAEQLERLESVLKSGVLPNGQPLTAEQRQHLERVRSGLDQLGKKVTLPE